MSLSYFGPATWNTSVDHIVSITIPLLQGGIQPQGDELKHFQHFLLALQAFCNFVFSQALEVALFIYCQRLSSLL